jgi:bifunctional DNA-binding transcriptional regulator/antitoxin component of YhaV-PrlF toxin-antitoxin module
MTSNSRFVFNEKTNQCEITFFRELNVSFPKNYVYYRVNLPRELSEYLNLKNGGNLKLKIVDDKKQVILSNDLIDSNLIYEIKLTAYLFKNSSILNYRFYLPKEIVKHLNLEYGGILAMQIINDKRQILITVATEDVL